MYRNVQECTRMSENVNKYKSKLIHNNIIKNVLLKLNININYIQVSILSKYMDI